MIEKVHGTHRSCVYSHARGWHRHVGPYNRTVSCGYPYYYEDPFWGSPGITFWFGPSPRYYRHRPSGIINTTIIGHTTDTGAECAERCYCSHDEPLPAETA
jgi:hypothetical protein